MKKFNEEKRNINTNQFSIVLPNSNKVQGHRGEKFIFEKKKVTKLVTLYI